MGRMIDAPGELTGMMNKEEDMDVFSALQAGEVYYIRLPKKYIVKKLAHFFLLFAVISLLFHPLFSFPLIPFLLLNLYKYRLFTLLLKSVNISEKKMWGILVIWLSITMPSGYFIREAVIDLLCR